MHVRLDVSNLSKLLSPAQNAPSAVRAKLSLNRKLGEIKSNVEMLSLEVGL